MGKHSARTGGSPVSRAFRIGALGVAAALLPLGVAFAPAHSTEVATPGSWTFYPGQDHTDSTSSAPGSTVYKTAVRPPVNADGSSNFVAKRGVIPIQFDGFAATSTVVTTTRTYDPPVWQSVGSTADAGDDVTYATFTPSTSLTFGDVTDVHATYEFTTGDCWGGSLRWTINVTHAGVPTNVYAYYGTPNGPDQTCSGSSSGSGDNLITTGITPDRFEVAGLTVPMYTTYAAVQAIVGGDQVNWVSLALDSGWKGDQRANVSDVTVNGNTWLPKTSEVVGTDTTPGAFAKTCELPPASLTWYKDGGTVSGAVNEATSIQPSDDGSLYRQVDCKYIYNLSVSSLAGVGSYEVYATIGGTDVPGPARFELR